MEFDGIRLVGVSAESGRKLLLTIAAIVVVWLLNRGLRWLLTIAPGHHVTYQARFWTRQGINLASTVLLLPAILSIWFDDPTRLATALGLVTAGLAFALQKVITSVAGYFAILRGNNFTVGDRITMGGVRGDVIGLGLIQTTIMEMGQPPAIQSSPPPMWVHSRQYTGRIVTVSNDKIFDEPVYNYTRNFPYIWEEISLSIPYAANRERAEQILLHAARRQTTTASETAARALDRLAERFAVQLTTTEPQVYYRLIENGLELTVRFVTEARGIRDVKDAMCREILREFDAAGIGIASATFEVVGLADMLRSQSASHPRDDLPT